MKKDERSDDEEEEEEQEPKPIEEKSSGYTITATDDAGEVNAKAKQGAEKIQEPAIAVSNDVANRSGVKTRSSKKKGGS